MGSRYGGLKQIDPVGPGGETVLDYAVFDSLRAGFTRIVFVIRRDFEAIFREKIGARYAGRAAVDYVFQSLDVLPAGAMPPVGRQKPWGTGHAVWCAREAIGDNFAVINADDFYGVDSFTQLARFLSERKATDRTFAMVGFKLENTLSEHGSVARGVTTAGANGELSLIVERTGIAASDVGAGRTYSGKEIVSMNCWGFTPAFFAGLDVQFREFLGAVGVPVDPVAIERKRDEIANASKPDPMKAEFYLPVAVSNLIARGEANVRVLPTESVWFGVTYRDDKPRVEAAIRELVHAGKYPAKLWP
jgi:hypothetical protein